MHDDWCMIPMTLFSVYNLKFDAKATFEKWLASKIKFIQLARSRSLLLTRSLFFRPIVLSTLELVGLVHIFFLQRGKTEFFF